MGWYLLPRLKKQTFAVSLIQDFDRKLYQGVGYVEKTKQTGKAIPFNTIFDTFTGSHLMDGRSQCFK
jgi:hypothetical protein